MGFFFFFLLGSGMGSNRLKSKERSSKAIGCFVAVSDRCEFTACLRKKMFLGGRLFIYYVTYNCPVIPIWPLIFSPHLH